MPTVEKGVEVGWARGGQEAAERVEAESLLAEAEAAFGQGDFLSAADILHGLREGGFVCGGRADRLADDIRWCVPVADLARFDRALSVGLPPKPESGADGGVSGSTGQRQPVGAGPWTVSVAGCWLAVSAIFAAMNASEHSVVVIPWGALFLFFLAVFSLPAFLVWLVGYEFMRRAQCGHGDRRP